MQAKLSIIIPVLNEEKVLPELLNDIGICQENLDFPMECIIVDGGSNDGSVKICEEFDVSVFQSPRGRGQQLWFGAQKSLGEILLFLHADSRILPQHCINAVETIESDGVVAGGFILKFDDPHLILKFAERIDKLRFRLTKIFYGDHGFFLSRSQYFATGEFPRQSLFEDIELSRRLKKMGKVVCYSHLLKNGLSAHFVLAGRFFRTVGGVVQKKVGQLWS